MNFNSLFETLWWLEAVAPKCDWQESFIKDSEDSILARTVYPNKTSYTMPKYTQTIGFWINPEVLESDTYGNERKRIIQELISKWPQKVNINIDSDNQYFLPFIWSGYQVRPMITYRIIDLSDIDAVYSKFAKVVKKNIKSASNKTDIVDSDDISILKELVCKTFALQGRKAGGMEVIDRIYNASKANNAVKLLYALDKKTGEPHSGVMFVYDDNRCYYLIGGTDSRFRSSGANSLLIWEGIKFASTVCRSFDFEGSMIEGIENFFRQFGGMPITYFNISKDGLIGEFKQILKPRIKKLLGYI